MTLKGYLVTTLSLLSCCMVFLQGCHSKDRTAELHFTKADSLTETYLTLQDSMLHVWNTMMYDDHRKVKAMHGLLRELALSDPEKKEELKSYQERLDHLISLRYDQKSMSDPDLVAEYDFASNSLVTDLISMAEAQEVLAPNANLQKLVNNIRASDQRVDKYREAFDFIAGRYNRFIERNHDMLQEIEGHSALQKQPLFGMAAQ